MSIKTFFKKIEEDIAEVFGKLFSVTWERKAQLAIQDAAPFIEGILAVADPAIEPIVASVLNTVNADLATVTAIVSQGAVAPGSTNAAKISAALNAVKSNLAALLADADIKNSKTVAQITAAVNVVTNAVDTVLSQVPKPPAGVSA